MNTPEIKNAPLIPITETVIYPGISNRIFVNEDIGNNIKELITKNNTLAIGLSTKDYRGLVQLTADSFYRIGVLMKFDSIQKSDNGFIIDITTINLLKFWISPLKKNRSPLLIPFRKIFRISMQMKNRK